MNDRDEQYGRRELLYDEELLGELVDDHGNAIEIKHEVRTPAHIYEIRTAVEYWFGGENNHRTSDRIWQTCHAVEAGQYVVVGDELKYAEQVDL
jgi:hypothetical protein